MVYLISSAAIAAFFGVALANYFNMITVIAITFFASLLILTSVNSIILGENKAFNIGFDIVSDSNWWYSTWWIGLLPLLIFLIVGIVGGIITAPVWYILVIFRNLDDKVVVIITMCIFGVLFLALLAVVLGLFFAPMLVYSFVHYGCVIAACALFAVAAYFIFMNMTDYDMISGGLSKALSVVSCILLPAAITGVVLSLNSIYRISTPREMNVLGNAPINYNTVFVLENDIDFEGEKVNWYGKRRNFDGIFDGQGYTLSNIEVTVRSKKIKAIVPYGAGFVVANTGIIKNLEFENAKISVKHNRSNKMYFGIIAAVNAEGKIANCKVVDSQARYCVIDNPKPTVCAKLTVGENIGSSMIENVSYVEFSKLPESFYYDHEKTWHKVSGQ